MGGKEDSGEGSWASTKKKMLKECVQIAIHWGLGKLLNKTNVVVRLTLEREKKAAIRKAGNEGVSNLGGGGGKREKVKAQEKAEAWHCVISVSAVQADPMCLLGHTNLGMTRDSN